MREQDLHTIVVGSGAAGFSAALRLDRLGVGDLALITENRMAGTSRNTGSDKQTYYKLSVSGSDPDSVRGMAQDLFEAGCVDGDQALCEAALSARCFYNLVELGVPFPDSPYGEFVGYKTDHDPRTRATSAGPYTSKMMTEVLERVGLGDQLKKRPNEMSGGQMQRVAIARALVNDPDILLADEPTGALDSETSLQVMDILREIARDKLVIMVTHNPDLAEKYATRTIRLLDGKVISDTGGGKTDSMEKPEPGERKQKTSMSFRTALGLSLNNLLTKKGRTLLTAFAGSIGIIGIALIMSLSNGVNNYIDRVQRDTLSSYPIEIDLQTVDMSDTMASLMDIRKDAREHEDGKVYSGSRMTQLMSAWMSGIATNDLKSLKAFIDDPGNGIQELVSGIEYEYDTPLTIYRTDDPEHIMQVNPSTAMSATGMMDMVNASAATGFQGQSGTAEGPV